VTGDRRIFIAFDVMRYRGAAASQHAGIQSDLRAAVEKAARDARLPFDRWYLQPQGDGMLVSAPLDAEPRYIDDFISHLQSALRRRNRDRVPEGRLRLRMGLAQGPSDNAAMGFTGAAPILACSLRDAAATRMALADSGADLVLAVSERSFADNVEQDRTRVSVDDFTQVRILEEKFHGTAWIWLPRGHSSPSLHRAASRRPSTPTYTPRDDSDFPVLLERGLDEPRRRAFGLLPAVRDPSEIPVQRPGTVLLFYDGLLWTQATGRVTGAEDFVRRALAVSVVWTRPRHVNVDLAIPSLDPADDFTVVASFRCIVTDTQIAAEEGPIDVVERLRSFLQRDPRLLHSGVQHRVEAIHSVRQQVQERVRQYCAAESPGIAGVDAALMTASVLTPEGLRTHTRKVRDARWAHDLAELLDEHGDADAKRLATRFDDPEFVDALAPSRDEIDLDNLVVDEYADQKTKDAYLLELLTRLEKNGRLEQLPNEGRALVNRLIERYGDGEPSD
jgi:hypothetical protein